MTAINVIRRPDAVFVLTDGAHYDDNGVVGHIGQKVIVLPFLRAVIAARGPSELFAALHLKVFADMPRSFEQLVDELPNMVREITADYHRSAAEVMLAGISFDRQATESYVLFTEETAGMSPFVMHELPPVQGAPAPNPLQAAEFGLGSITPETFNPYVHGPAILQAQRRTLVGPEKPYDYSVGGFVMLNTIHSGGVNSEILHVWPDEIGHVIEPA
jgi:hypothetical protein